MPLEATMFCVDNSDWMRNGDYTPTRLDAQRETVQAIANQKLRSNQESIVGLLSLAGERPDVVHSPSRNMGQILTELKALRPSGTSNICAGLKIAQLSLKNRQNKVQRQRVILFVGSPVTESVDELTAVAKQLRKNNVALDVVHFGSENAANDSAERLEALVAAINNAGNSHILYVPAGVYRLSDSVMASPIGNDGAQPAAAARPAAAGGAGFGDGPAGMDDIDALMETDPELAMALRMSLEDSRPAAAAAPAAAPAAAATTVSATQAAKDAEAAAAAAAGGALMEDDDDDDAALAAAIALSMAEAVAPAPNAPAAATSTAAVPATPAPAAAGAVATAPAAPVKPAAPASATDIANAMDDGVNDPAFLAALLGSVDGLNSDEVNDIIKVRSYVHCAPFCTRACSV